ncbi:ATP-binding protein [uncultured Polaribacter sp.]|uniref:hybrid sensor histidine kinase/response regulator transcription factor n=1 Tax=uncultured Polaribacter sp. TaxID=174711 RepID=UPI00261BD63F|nr:ATP-binding protein [uncultured Polaribacter sp.]
MKNIFFNKYLILSFIISFLSCQPKKETFIGSNEEKVITEKEFDSIQKILWVDHKPFLTSKLVNRLSKDNYKNPEDKLKVYRLLFGYYMLISDYENSNIYADKMMEHLRKENQWERYVVASKSVAMSYRGEKRYDEIEKLLKETIQIAKEKKVGVKEILPIHELSVFYTYDVSNHKEAIKYGEIYFAKIAKYDSIIKTNKRYKNMVKATLSVLNLTLGKSYTKANNLDKAYIHLKKAENFYTQKWDLEKLTRAHSNLLDYYILKNDLKNITLHKNKFLHFTTKHKDSLIKTFTNVSHTEKEIAEDEKEEIVLSEKNKRKNLIGFAIALLVILVLLFQFYFLKLRFKLKREQEFKKFRSSLFVNIAHEIRTPLSLILGYLDLSLEKNISKEDSKKYLHIIKDNSKKIIRNVSDVITLLKENKTEEKLPLENIIIEPVLQMLFFCFESVAKLKNITLNYNATLPVNYVLLTNIDKLESVINNLVYNAIKFSPKNSEVFFNTFIKDNFFHIHITDHGIGISKQNQKNIFNKFYQEDGEQKAEGFGIGLAIVKDIIDKFNGTITANSVAGEGTTFRVALPINKNDEQSELKVISKKINKFNRNIHDKVLEKTINLLIVEDNSYLLDYYNKILSPKYNCTFALNGVEGLEKFTNNDFDLVISDMLMPEMNGIELRKRLKKDSKGKNTPFIMVTALDYEENKIEAYNVGVDDYIIKPFYKNELIARINNLISNKEIRKTWQESLDEKDETTQVESFDDKMLKQLYDFVIEHLDDEEYSVTKMAEQANFSKRKLERVIKKITGLTPVKFILEVRLQQAYKKIKNKEEADINSVRYSVGIKSASYFSVKFKSRFGVSPKKLMNDN